MSTKRKISVVTCAFNEEDCIEELARRLFNVFDTMPQYEFEVIAIENGSHDRTLEQMQQVHRRDARFRIVQLVRNFGLDGGFAAGLDLADGDAVVIMAADLQDPPELLPQLISKWEEGYDNVYGIVANRVGTPVLRRINSHIVLLADRQGQRPPIAGACPGLPPTRPQGVRGGPAIPGPPPFPQGTRCMDRLPCYRG